MRLSVFGRIGRAKPFVAALGLLLLGACASGANPGAMTAPLTEQTMLGAESALRQAVQVGTVAGGRDTNPLLASQVSSTDFAAALRQSLATHAMLAINNQLYRLDATLLSLDQPMLGFDMTVRARVQYRLTRLADGQVVFDREIEASFTANFSSSFYGVERLRLANEGAIRENISRFLTTLVAEERANPATFGAAAPRTS